MSVDKNIKVSVILPVYNVEAYIERCIESLQAQTMQELEFIFVDDCSTDGSVAAVEAWAKEDERVRILRNKQNLGAGPSRNRGIEIARGEYLSFVDPDDYVSSNFYELLYAAATKSGDCDIAKGVRIRVDLQAGIQYSEADMNKHIMRAVKRGRPIYLSFRYGHQAALYHQKLFGDSCVRYGTSRNGQDLVFLLRLCTKAKTICFDNNARYFYRYGREGAVTAQYSFRRVFRDLDALEQRIDYLLGTERSDYWYDYLAHPFSIYLNRIYLAWKNGELNSGQQETLLDRIICQLFRVPDYHILMNTIPELEVLVRHGTIVPAYGPEVSVCDCLKEWVSFFERENALESPYKEACSFAVIGCIIDGLRGNRGAFKCIKAQLSRLNPMWRKQIMAAVPKTFATKLGRRLKEIIGG